MPGVHSILSPSSAHRWLACTPSARFEEQIPEEESPYAAEGTLAHKLAALMLAHTEEGESLKSIQSDPLYSEEMKEHCGEYAKYVTERAGDAPLFIEKTYDMSEYIPLQKGTADVSWVSNGTICVTDFKYGAGVKVSATGNKQMMCYALGAYEYHRKGHHLESVCMTIYQPRTGGVSSWELPVTDLLKWAEEEARPCAVLAIAGGGEFVAGEHCRFCKARTRCKAYYERFASLKGLRDKREITDGELAEVLTYGPLVASWVKKVEEETIKRIRDGNPLEGFKLVKGTGKRSFKNEDDVVDILLGEGYESDLIYDSKLKSLTALEKQMGKKRFKELFENEIIKTEGPLKAVPESDGRTAAEGSEADEYD